MSLPFISVCIPAYQRPLHLHRLLSSLTAQTFKDFEVIITDDSPGEEVLSVVKEFSGLPINYSRNEVRAGSPANWNRAIEQAGAAWIQLMHSDDWYATPYSLQTLANAANHSGKDFIFSASYEINERNNQRKLLNLDDRKRTLLEDPFSLLYENHIGHPSVVLHRRDQLLQYDTSFRWVVDIDFYIRYLRNHGSFHYINETLVNIGVDETMISHTSYKNPNVEIPEYLQLLAKYKKELEEGDKFAFFCLWKLAKKFRLKPGTDLGKFGYGGEKPNGLDMIIQYQEKIPRIILKQTHPSEYFMKRCYQKFLKQLRHSSS